MGHGFRCAPPAPHSRAVLHKTMNQEIEWGLAACGRSGETSIDIDESVSWPDIYEIELTKTRWCLRFRITNTKVVFELLDFIKNGDDPKYKIGTFNGLKVYIHRDSEFSDRFFIAIEGKSGNMRYTIDGVSEINEFIEALEQAIEDLQ